MRALQNLRSNQAQEEEKKHAFEIVTEGNDEMLSDHLKNLLNDKSQTLEKMRNHKSIVRILSQIKE